VDQLATLLQRAGYSAEGIHAIGVDVGLGIRRTDVTTLLRALDTAEPLSGFVRLFLLGSSLKPTEVEQLGLNISALSSAGVLQRRGGRIEASLHITPWRSLLIAHDPDPPGDLWPTHVSGPTPAAETLAQLIVRSPVRSMLDLGTGSGLLAILAARHAERVVATDVNPHALRLAALNAQLNDVSNVEVREGSYFQPVDGERFELIVSNPPYVIAPESDLLFRYGLGTRDAVSRDVLRGAAEHLAEDGLAQMFCNWIGQPGGDWRATPSGWIESAGCDLLLMHYATEDPLAYASRWTIRLQQLAPARFPATLDRWLAFYETEGIAAITSGAAVLRRRSGGTNWVHGIEIESDATGDAGAHILDIIAGQDYLADIADDRAMLAGVFRLAEPHRLDQSLLFRGDRYTIGRAALVRDGLGLRAEIEPGLVGLVLRFDGATPLERLIDEVASDTGAAYQELVPAALALVRRLIGVGLLLRPPSAPPARATR
jgi:SAM-dependent methyltransferase